MRGKDQLSTASSTCDRDHPRLCGEKVCGAYRTETKSGITPAYAGKREENIMNKINVEGSPPPMRGKDVVADTATGAVGITPAYAGKSPLSGI